MDKFFYSRVLTQTTATNKFKSSSVVDDVDQDNKKYDSTLDITLGIAAVLLVIGYAIVMYCIWS